MSRKKIIIMLFVLPILLTGCLNQQDKKWVSTQAELFCLSFRSTTPVQDYLNKVDDIAKKYGFTSAQEFSSLYAQAGSVSETKIKDLTEKAIKEAVKQCGYHQ
jgi:hypothetical protein